MLQVLLSRESRSIVVPCLLEFLNNACTPFHATGKFDCFINVYSALSSNKCHS
jgi:hypothetical protein